MFVIVIVYVILIRIIKQLFIRQLFYVHQLQLLYLFWNFIEENNIMTVFFPHRFVHLKRPNVLVISLYL